MTGSGRDAGARRDLPRAQVNGERFWANLNELGQIGRGERGVSRLAFAPTDMEGRRWLLRKMEDAGLKAWMDQVGNVFGRLEPAVRGHKHLPGWKGQPAILMGSHIDTVPEGGMFDGTLGVLAGLECLQTVRDAGLALEHPLELAAFADEEGSRIVPGTFGSRAFSLGIPESEWARVSLVLKEAGLVGPAAGTSYLARRRSASRCIQDVIEACARDLGLATRRMPSGAGHDAMNLAKHVPTGMIFVPSRGGISHSPKECTSKGQCVAGASVLLRTVLALYAGAHTR